MPKAVCNYCGGVELEYSPMDVFTHWEFPYVFCPFCGNVVIVKGDINKIIQNESEDDNAVDGTANTGR